MPGIDLKQVRQQIPIQTGTRPARLRPHSPRGIPSAWPMPHPWITLRTQPSVLGEPRPPPLPVFQVPLCRHATPLVGSRPRPEHPRSRPGPLPTHKGNSPCVEKAIWRPCPNHGCVASSNAFGTLSVLCHSPTQRRGHDQGSGREQGQGRVWLLGRDCESVPVSEQLGSSQTGFPVHWKLAEMDSPTVRRQQPRNANREAKRKAGEGHTGTRAGRERRQAQVRGLGPGTRSVPGAEAAHGSVRVADLCGRVYARTELEAANRSECVPVHARELAPEPG